MKTISYYLLRTLFAIVVGLILVLWPDAAADYIVITIGVMFLVPGLIALIGYFALRPRYGMRRRFPIESIGSILFGVWLIAMPSFFADVLMFILGFILMMGGIQQIVSLVMARRWMRVSAGFYIVPLLILMAGVVALFNPSGTRETAFIIIGVSSMVYAITELINYFKFTRRRPKSRMVRTIEDAEIVE